MGGNAGHGSTSGLSRGGSSMVYLDTDSDGGEVGEVQRVHLAAPVGFSGDALFSQEVED